MKIDDLLSQAGNKPLSEFAWSAGVLEVINSELTTDRKIDGTITGFQAAAVIRTLSSAALVRLFTMRVNGDGAPHEDQDPPPACETPITTDKTKWWSRMSFARAALPLVVGLTITMIGVLMAAVVAFNSVRTGQVPDGGSLQGIAQIMSEMVKVYSGSTVAAEPTPRQPEPQPDQSLPPTYLPPSYPTDEQPEPLLPVQ